MNKYIVKIIMAGSLIMLNYSCSPKIMSPREYATNVELIEKSIANIKPPTKNLNKGDKIAIINLDNARMKPTIHGFFEDNLTTLFSKNGFKVVDRNNHMIRTASEEAENKLDLSKKWEIIKKHKSDKIFAYRILEAGVKFSPIKQTHALVRNAYTKMHFRIIESRSGLVLETGELEGRTADQLSREEYKAVRKPFVFYAYSMPNRREPVRITAVNFRSALKGGAKGYSSRSMLISHKRSTVRSSYSAQMMRLLSTMFRERGKSGYHISFGMGFGVDDFNQSGFSMEAGRVQKQTTYSVDWRIGYLSFSGKKKSNWNGKEYDNNTTIIPVSAFIQYNLNSFNEFKNLHAPYTGGKLSPFVEAGLSYAIISKEYKDPLEDYNEKSYFELSLDLGFGLEYYLNEKYSVEFTGSRHSVFTEFDKAYWNWRVGMNFY